NVSTRFTVPTDVSSRAPVTMFEPGFRSPLVQSWFLGIQKALLRDLSIEINELGAAGRQLITTDLLNRGPNTLLGFISYGGNQGSSSYNGLSTVVRWRTSRLEVQGAYTWSHTLDNQSEVLRNDYFNLNPTRLTAPQSQTGFSAFAREFDSGGDGGNS